MLRLFIFKYIIIKDRAIYFHCDLP